MTHPEAAEAGERGEGRPSAVRRGGLGRREMGEERWSQRDSIKGKTVGTVWERNPGETMLSEKTCDSSNPRVQ